MLVVVEMVAVKVVVLKVEMVIVKVVVMTMLVTMLVKYSALVSGTHVEFPNDISDPLSLRPPPPPLHRHTPHPPGYARAHHTHTTSVMPATERALVGGSK